MIASEGFDKNSIQSLIERELVPRDSELGTYELYDCRISEKGLTTSVIDDDSMSIDNYSKDWMLL